MKLKERMAQDYAENEHKDDMAGDRSIAWLAYLAGFEARGEMDAERVFEKIRCDDRTDRWLVANEVAAHVRALDEQEEGV